MSPGTRTRTWLLPPQPVPVQAAVRVRFWNPANQVTVLRVLVVVVALVLMRWVGPASAFAVALIPLAFALDMVDGMVARRTGSATVSGAMLDVFADRVVETMLWLFFLGRNLVPVWAVIVVVTRGLATDFVRSQGSARGVAVNNMLESRAGRLLVSSPASRFLYALLKSVLFTALAAATVTDVAWLHATLVPLVVATVAANLVRGYPVLIEGRRFF
ncbi:MAG: CDP-alcohol phosphatidyltransferase family protein [Thermoplasmatota archaeon]